jgi:hypothetical protein
LGEEPLLFQIEKRGIDSRFLLVIRHAQLLRHLAREQAVRVRSDKFEHFLPFPARLL